MTLLGITILLVVLLNHRIVSKGTEGRIYSLVEEIPSNKIGLLLGTGKILSNGHINLYYKYRLEAAAKLFKAGKIEYILISGDNSRKDYDEPSTMKEDLIKMGIPANRIVLDYAGFRTFDSVVRCKEIFCETRATVISQQFHNERALFIAQNKGIKAIGFNAKDVNARYGITTNIRERLARTKLMLDIFFGIGPKYLGEKIPIG